MLLEYIFNQSIIMEVDGYAIGDLSGSLFNYEVKISFHIL